MMLLQETRKGSQRSFENQFPSWKLIKSIQNKNNINDSGEQIYFDNNAGKKQIQVV